MEKSASDLERAWGRTIVGASSKNPKIPTDLISDVEAMLKKAEALFNDAQALLKKADAAYDKIEKDYEAEKSKWVEKGEHPDDFISEGEGDQLSRAMKLLESFSNMHGKGMGSTYDHIRRTVDMLETDVERLVKGR